MADTEEEKKYGELYQITCWGFPRYKGATGRLDVKRLAEDMGISYQMLYRYFRQDRIRVGSAKTLVNLSKGRLSLADFLEFLY